MRLLAGNNSSYLTMMLRSWSGLHGPVSLDPHVKGCGLRIRTSLTSMLHVCHMTLKWLPRETTLAM